MKLPIELLFLLFSVSSFGPTIAAPVDAPPTRHHARDVSFLSLRGLTTLTRDHTAAVAFSHPNKFFHESTFSGHYDGRFADKPLPDDVRIHHLRLLLASYLHTMERIGVRTWLMHGCLLGWWWNGQIMPWDTDVDVMVDERGVAELGAWWNMSVHHFTRDDLKRYVPLELRGADEDRVEEDSGAPNKDTSHENIHVDILKGGKKYLLEVNPHYMNTSTTDKENVIDARWIDTQNGLFIDITTIHVQPIVEPGREDEGEKEEEEEDLELYTKDQHAYSYSQMFPLRTSTLEGLKVHVPYNYEELLLDEYGPKAITHTWFRGWKFDDNEHKWILSPEQESNQQSFVNEGPDNKGGTSKKQDPNVYLMRGGNRAAVGRRVTEVS